jgi:hypothetical protein
MHTMMAAVASLSLAKMVSPWLPVGATLIQGLGINKEIGEQVLLG